MTTLAFLGLGAMGSRMAARARRAASSLALYNRTPPRASAWDGTGIRLAPTPRDAATGADIVVSMVTQDDASREVWLHPETGALAGLAPGATIVECSTVTPEHVRALAGEVARRGVNFVEAPVLGSRPQAEGGQLVTLLAGADTAIARVRPLLDTWSSRVIPLGPQPGQAATLKLVVNSLLALQAAGVGELLGWVHRSGLDESSVADLLASLPVTSPAAGLLLKSMAARQFAPNFPISLVAKDLRYALTTAQAQGASLPVLSEVLNAFAEAERQGYGEENISAVARLAHATPASPTPPR